MLRSNRRLLQKCARNFRCFATTQDLGANPEVPATSRQRKGVSKISEQLRNEQDELRQRLDRMNAQTKLLEIQTDFSASVMTNIILWQLSDDLREVVVNKVFKLSHKKFTWKAYSKWLNNNKYSDEQVVPFADLLMTPLCEPCDKDKMTWGVIRHTGKYNSEPSTPTAKDMAFAVWGTRSGEHMLSHEEALVVLKILNQKEALDLVFSSNFPEPTAFNTHFK